MNTVAEPRLTAAPPPRDARERALRRWFPWCNAKVAQAIRIARPQYPLIEGGRARRDIVLESQPMPSFDGGGRAA